MPEEVTKLIHKYLRHDKKFPHVWCPGCGNGIVLGALIRAIDRLGLEKDEMVISLQSEGIISYTLHAGIWISTLSSSTIRSTV